MCDLNNNVYWNDQYILISIFVRAQSTRFRMYRSTRIPCATRFRNASTHRRPCKATRQPGPCLSKRPHTGISKRVDVISSLRKTRKRPSSCVYTFHPGSGARPGNTRFCLPQAQSRFRHQNGVHRLSPARSSSLRAHQHTTLQAQ